MDHGFQVIPTYRCLGQIVTGIDDENHHRHTVDGTLKSGKLTS